jgi:hypothetical protein
MAIQYSKTVMLICWVCRCYHYSKAHHPNKYNSITSNSLSSINSTYRPIGRSNSGSCTVGEVSCHSSFTRSSTCRQWWTQRQRLPVMFCSNNGVLHPEIAQIHRRFLGEPAEQIAAQNPLQKKAFACARGPYALSPSFTSGALMRPLGCSFNSSPLSENHHY